jgi:hypothetical protein
MLKNCYVKASVVCILAGLLMASVASAIPTNGDFSQPISVGWTVESGTVTVIDGYAKFEEDESLMSSLINDQPFTIPAGALDLSFDLKMDVKGLPSSDAFTVSLLDPGFNPLISYDPGVVTWFYYLENPYVEPMTVATVNDIGNDWKRVTLHVSSLVELGPQDVLLAFDLFSIDDTVTTTVSLDNVNVTIIPAPGALLLGFIGTGLVSLLRRSKTMI